MKHGSLFSGIGGFDLAAEWAGWDNIFHCEWNPFGQKVLKHYWPKAITYEDITKTDFTVHRGQIDILTGGFPCQPYSQAGKRLGKEDDRHLWPEMLRAIREIQPRYIVGENVSGLVNWNGGMVFNEVQAEMEAEGYEVTPFILPACAVNAPHRRDRVWFVSRLITDSGSAGCNRNKEFKKRCNSKRDGISLNEPDTLYDGGLRNESEEKRTRESNQSPGSLCGISHPNDSNSINKGLQGGKLNGTPDQEGKNRGKQSSRSTTELHQINDWEQFPTQSPVCNGDDGLSTRLDGITFSKWRNESIKAGGNAIVPQVAFQIFQAINKFELL
jgi:DNA (cytosine-5)-methyltransferase 1